MSKFSFLGELSFQLDSWTFFCPTYEMEFLSVFWESLTISLLLKVRACSVNLKQSWCCPACRLSSHLALIFSKVLQYGSQLWEKSWDPNLGEPLEGAQQIAVADDMTLQPQGNIPLWHASSVGAVFPATPSGLLVEACLVKPRSVRTLEMLSMGLGKLGGDSCSWQRVVFHLAVISHTSSYQLLVHLIH